MTAEDATLTTEERDALWAASRWSDDMFAAVESIVAARVREAVARARAEALREAADAIQPGDHDCCKPWCPECAQRHEAERTRDWLRDRAAAAEAQGRETNPTQRKESKP